MRSLLVLGGSMIEALAGVVAVVLATLGLVGIAPGPLALLAIVAIAAGLVIEGFAIKTGGDDDHEVSVQLAGGLAVLALALVASVVTAPELRAFAVIGLGGALVLGAGSTAFLDTERHRAGGVQVLAGLAAAGLGALTLGHLGDGVLPACLIAGGSMVLSGATIGARLGVTGKSRIA